MRPHSDAEAPSIEYGVLQRLKRLDRDLMVTWAKWSIDPLSGSVLEHRGRPVLDPCFHLWIRHGAGDDWTHCALYPHEKGFGHPEVAKLERDVARYMAPGEIMRASAEGQRARRAKAKADLADEQSAKIRANKSKINDMLFEESNTVRDSRRYERDGKLFSGGGISRRGSSGRVPVSNKEAGWELPEN